jgi:hypothetical protein
MSRAFPPSFAAALAVVALALPARAEPEIRAITLSTAGLALVEAEATLGPDPLHLTVPRARIDDFLKSLRIDDPAGAVARLALPGPGAFEDTFARLPFAPDDVTDPVRLLDAMIGAPLSVETGAETLQGTNMGVSMRDCEAGACPILTLVTGDGGLREVWLGSGVSVRLADAEDRAALETALAALRAGPEPRQMTVDIASDDDSERDARLAWLQEAPVWRTAWRAVEDGEDVRLTGWAVIENATGRDWRDVRLTLATGAVRAIAADLYARRHGWREPEAAPAFARTLAAPESMQADTAVADVAAEDSDSVTRFTLAAPVTLAAGQMLSLPFLSEILPEARLRLHRGGTGAQHPVIALEIENPLPLRLPAGVLTLYEEGIGHAGDALIPELPPEGRAVVDFARDTAIEIRESAAREEVVRRMRLVRGVLEVAEDLVRETRYRISGAAAADRTLTLEHPRSDDWALDDPSGVEARPDAWRWRIDLPAGAEVVHIVRERQPRLRRLAVADMDIPTLGQWEARSPDPELRERLAEIAGLRREVVEAEAGRERAEAEIAALEREQARLVDLIVRLDDDSAANRARRARVDALDAEIAAAEESRRALAARIDALRAELADLMAE